METQNESNQVDFYMTKGTLNPNWNSEPADEWGTAGGTYAKTYGELPVVAMQRKDVPDYAFKFSPTKKGLEDINSINFIPRQSKEKAEAEIGRMQLEQMRQSWHY